MLNIKRNKIQTTLILVITFLATQFIQAQHQDQQGPPPMPNTAQIETMVNEMAKELSLTDKQKDQVSEQFENHFKEMEKMRASSGDSQRPDREVMEKNKREFEKEIKAILTPEQQKQFDVFMKEQQSKRGKSQKPQD